MAAIHISATHARFGWMGFRGSAPVLVSYFAVAQVPGEGGCIELGRPAIPAFSGNIQPAGMFLGDLDGLLFGDKGGCFTLSQKAC